MRGWVGCQRGEPDPDFGSGNMKPKIHVVITRIPSFAQLVKDAGLSDNETKVLETAGFDDVRGLNICTDRALPQRLMAAARTVTTPTDQYTIGTAKVESLCGLVNHAATPEGERTAARTALARKRVWDTFSMSPAIPVEAERKAVTPVAVDASKSEGAILAGLIRAEADRDEALRLELAKQRHAMIESRVDPKSEWICSGDRTYLGRWHVHPRNLNLAFDYKRSDYAVYRDGGSWMASGVANLDRVAWELGEIKDGRRTWKSLAEEHRSRGDQDAAARCEEASQPWEFEPVDVPFVVLAEVYTDRVCGRSVTMQREPILFARVTGVTRTWVGRWRGLQSKGWPEARVGAVIEWVREDVENAGSRFSVERRLDSLHESDEGSLALTA